MDQTEIYILGYPILIKYQLHELGYVEWSLLAENQWTPAYDLLNVLLRVHYSPLIEAICREDAFYRQYAESMAPYDNEDLPF